MKGDGYLNVFLRATVLAIILTAVPLAGLFVIRQAGNIDPFIIMIWILGAILWNIIILTLFLRGRF